MESTDFISSDLFVNHAVAFINSPCLVCGGAHTHHRHSRDGVAATVEVRCVNDHVEKKIFHVVEFLSIEDP